MSARLEQVAGPRAGERGAILLIVLILSVTISLLSMALIATAEVSLRAEANGDDLERAEHGARSGVEWAAAVVKKAGVLAFQATTTLDSGVVVTCQARLLGSPRLLGKGVSNGVTVTVGADLLVLEDTRPYAFLSFADTNSPRHAVTVDGMAYLGEAGTPLNTSSILQMAGDLDLVSTTTLAPGQVSRTGGTTNYGVAALSAPAWDTTSFTLSGNWTVPYRSVSGTTTIKDQTINGLLVATLAAGQTLTLDNVILNGTLVVPWTYPPLLELLGTPTITLKGATIVGGTAETGNLAVLAPGCLLQGNNPTSGSITGVCYVRQLDGLRALDVGGKMLVRKAMVGSTGSPITFRRAADFLPDVPVGIQQAGNQMAIRWLGRQ